MPKAGNVPRFNVVQIISSGGLYGAERVMLELAEYLASRGLGSSAIILESPGATDVATELKRAGLPVEIVDGSPLSLAAKVRRNIQRNGVHVVHSHGYRPDVCLALARLGPDVLKVATCHTWYRESWKLKLYEVMDKAALRTFNKVVAVSPELESEILRSGVAGSKVSFIQNGMDFDRPAEGNRIAIRNALGVHDDEVLLLRVGRLAAAKGNDVLLDALAKLPAGRRWKLVFAGDGEERERLAAHVKTRNLDDRVVFAGFRKDIRELLTAADLFVIPSLKEGLPMVLLEAMALSCPVITTSVGAIPNVITDGKDGLLVPPGDAGALRAAIAALLMDPDLGKSLAENAYQRYLERHSRSAMGEQYLALYESVLQRQRS